MKISEKNRTAYFIFMIVFILWNLVIPASAKEYQVKKAKLKNGLTVLLQENPDSPVVCTAMVYKVGSRNDNLDTIGISHLIEHMVLKNTKQYPKGKMSQTLNMLGADYQAFTSSDVTVFSETLPPEFLEIALRIEADRMSNAIITNQDIQVEKSVILAESAVYRSDPAYILWKEVRAASFTLHPYMWPVQGEEGTLQNLKEKNIAKHYKNYYQPDNAVLAISGNFDKNKAMNLINDLFGKIPNDPDAPKVRFPVEKSISEKRITIKDKGVRTLLHIAYKAPSIGESDIYPMAVIDAILTGGLLPRLKTSLEKEGYIYGVNAWLDTNIDPGLYYMRFTLKPGVDPKKVEEIVKGELDRLKNQQVSDEELQRAKNILKADFIRAKDSQTHQAQYLAWYENISSYKYLNEYLRRIDNVTPTEIMVTSQKYFVDEGSTVGLSLPPQAKIEPQTPPPPQTEEEGQPSAGENDKPDENKSKNDKNVEKEKSEQKADEKKSTDQLGDNSLSEDIPHLLASNRYSVAFFPKNSESSIKKAKKPLMVAAKTEPKNKYYKKNTSSNTKKRVKKDAKTKKTAGKSTKKPTSKTAKSTVKDKAKQKKVTKKVNTKEKPIVKSNPNPEEREPRISSIEDLAKQAKPYDLKYTRHTISNGVVLLIHENHSNPSVTIRGLIKAGGMYEPEGKYGLSKITASALPLANKTLKPGELTTQMDNLGADMRFDSSLQNIEFSSWALSEHLPKMIPLMAKVITEPAFDENQINNLKKITILSLKNIENNEEIISNRAFYKEVFPNNHPFNHFTLGNPETINSITKEDVENFYKEHFNPTSTIISVSGDVKTDEVIKLFEQELSPWKAECGESMLVMPTVNMPEQNRQFEIPGKNKNRVTIIMGHKGIPRNHPDYYKFKIMNYILGEAPHVNRLARKIQSKGLAYKVYSQMETSIGDGPWQIVMEVPPGKEDKAVNEVLNCIRSMQKTPPTSEELKTAQMSLTGNLPVYLETNKNIAAALLTMEYYRLESDYIKKYSQIYKSINGKDIQETAAKYLYPDKMTVIISRGAQNQ